jgi:hypothetical protein
MRFGQEVIVLKSLAVAALLLVYFSLATHSMLHENPTIDEVVHLPAGITYWETGSFRLYHHNPPLIKLIAALPVLAAHPATEPIYRTASWNQSAPFCSRFADKLSPTTLEIFGDPGANEAGGMPSRTPPVPHPRPNVDPPVG